MNQHLVLIAFCVVAGFAVTACQPKLMQNLSPSETPEPTPAVTSTPMPSGVPVTGTEKTMTPAPGYKKSGSANTEIDASLKENDKLLNSSNPDDVNGNDLK